MMIKSTNIFESMSTLKTKKLVNEFIFDYIENIKNSGIKNYIKQTELNIYPELLNHPNYNDIKNLWYPIPTKEEFKKKLRKRKIKYILYD